MEEEMGYGRWPPPSQQLTQQTKLKKRKERKQAGLSSPGQLKDEAKGAELEFKLIWMEGSAACARGAAGP